MANSNPLWNVNKYKSEFESEEHWQLRKKFMETHIDKFPEDKLVCLAQVFFNIEFLGCRYPEKTMKDIAELSKGVADEHRENQKGKLKRTFVQASDAAGAKIKGSGAQPLIEPQNKILKTSLETVSFVCPAHVNLTKPLPQPSTSGEFPGLIIFENCNRLGEVEACPINILTHSIQKDGMCNTIKFSHIGRTCTIVINGKVLASDEGSSHKEAKVNAAVKGLKLLRKTCYTIQAKRAFFSNNPSITKDGKVSESDAPLPEDNIGNRMMQKMGWGGSGLGKSQQGIQAPIQASPQIMNRAGFGCANQRDLENEFRTVFQDYIKSSSDSDLVFSPDFTPEERKTLHKVAQNLHLKTRSYGKAGQRHLVVYKHQKLRQTLQMLLACGGENDKYLLVPPTGEDDPGISSLQSESITDQKVSKVTSMSSESSTTKQDISQVIAMSSESSTTKQDISQVIAMSCESIATEQEMSTGTSMPTKIIVSEEDTSIVNFEQSTSKIFHGICTSNDTAECFNSKNNIGSEDWPMEKLMNPNCSANRITMKTQNNTSDISLVDEVLRKKDSDLRIRLNNYKNLMESYTIKGSMFTKKEERKYKACRNEFHKYTGKYIQNILEPVQDHQIKHQLIKHEHRCMALGMALARNSSTVKTLICERIRSRSSTKGKQKFYSKEKRKKVYRSISKEFTRFGNELLRKFFKNDEAYKSKAISSPLYDKLLSSNLKSAVPLCDPLVVNGVLTPESGVAITASLMSFYNQGATNGQQSHVQMSKVLKQSLRTKPREIEFVKENNIENDDEESGIEYSDVADTSDCSGDELAETLVETRLEGEGNSNQDQTNQNVADDIIGCAQPEPSMLKDTSNGQHALINDIENLVREDLENIKNISSVGNSVIEEFVRKSNNLNLFSVPNDKPSELNPNDHQMLTNRNTDEIDKYFSRLALIAKSLSPDICKKLKDDIRNSVVKALKANQK